MKDITREELSKMAESTSVIAIDGKVLDVTTYLDEHPGGREVIEEYRGKNASGIFNDIGHSKTAHTLIERYKIGDYAEPVSPPPPKYQSPTSYGTLIFLTATVFGVVAASISY